MDVFQGPSSQELGEEKGEGVVYSVVLKRVHSNQKVELPLSHLRWVSQKVRTVQAGTLERLVEHLAPDPAIMKVSQAYRTCFLAVYRSFTDTGTVVDLIVRRYLSLAREPEDTEDERQSKNFIQQELISFLRLWLDTYPGDFTTPPSHPHFTSLRPLIERSHDLEKTINIMSKDASTQKQSNGTMTPNEEDSQKSFSLFTMSPEEFSTALTSEDARLFLGVSASECLDYIRSPKDTTNAPTVRACIKHFNRVSLVVIATILGGLAADARAFIISQWIEIAQHCRAVKNFSSLKAIISGLQSTAVFRLKKTWLKISNSKLQLFQELSDLLSADANHQMSRDLLNREGTSKYAELPVKKGRGGRSTGTRQSVVGVVPYLGTFLTDLTMIDSAYQDQTPEGLINFDKFRKHFQLLAELTLYQKSAANYCFQGDHYLLQWLGSTHTTTPLESYKLSRQLEPDDSTNHTLTVSEPSQAPISPARIRKSLRHIFNLKTSSVGDFSPSHSHSPEDSPPHSSTSSITSSSSARELSSSMGPSPTMKTSRSFSLSPSTCRREILPAEGTGHGTEGRVVRVAISSCDHCNYKSMLLSVADKTMSIIQQSLEKHGLTGEPKNFKLFQIIGDKRQCIPSDANVFYALNNTEEYPTLLVTPIT